MNIQVTINRKKLLMVLLAIIVSIMQFASFLIRLSSNEVVNVIIYLISAIIYGIASFVMLKIKNTTPQFYVIIIFTYLFLLSNTLFKNKSGLSPLWLLLMTSITFFYRLKKRINYKSFIIPNLI